MQAYFGNRSNSRRLYLALVTIGISSFSPCSFAQYEASAYIPNGNLFGRTTTPGDVSYTYDSGAGATATASFAASPIASVSYATTALNPLGGITLSGGGIMTYRFLVAAQPFTSVPIDFSGFYSSSTSPAGPGYGAFTSFSVQTVNSSLGTYSTFESFFQGACFAPICLQYNTGQRLLYIESVRRFPCGRYVRRHA